MGRKRTTVLDDIIKIGSVLPWWASLIAAAATWIFFQRLAQIEPGTPSGIESMGNVMVRQMTITFSAIAQYVVPPLLLLGTAVGGVKNLSRSITYDSVKGVGWFSGRNRSDKVGALSWRQFENLIHEYFRRNGYAVTEAVAGPDGGVDLHLRKDDTNATVQCKHWRKKKVDARIVREQFGVMTAAGADECFVVTSGKFTEAARDFAKGQPITLIDGSRLAELMDFAVSARREAVQILAEPTVECPSCGSEMRLRTARRGPSPGSRFWGCSRFPKCRGTRQAV